MDNRISIDVDLIFSITRLPKAGVDLVPFFASKEHNPSLFTHTKEKYNLTQDKRGFSITSIRDTGVWFTSKVFSSKMLRKMQSNQCIVGTIIVVKQCAIGV